MRGAFGNVLLALAPVSDLCHHAAGVADGAAFRPAGKKQPSEGLEITSGPLNPGTLILSTVPPAPEAPSLSRVWRDVRDFKAFGSRVTQRCAVLGRLQVILYKMSQ